MGGLLALYDVSVGTWMLPVYDAMGNILAMTDGYTGNVLAAYEYDAFGNTLRQSGTYAAYNPFRFSTKYTDDETSLVYYGRRYFNPSQGRFIGRDPTEEKGGLHLYAFCRNGGVNAYDMLGQTPFTAEVVMQDGGVGGRDPTAGGGWTYADQYMSNADVGDLAEAAAAAAAQRARAQQIASYLTQNGIPPDQANAAANDVVEKGIAAAIAKSSNGGYGTPAGSVGSSGGGSQDGVGGARSQGPNSHPVGLPLPPNVAATAQAVVDDLNSRDPIAAPDAQRIASGLQTQLNSGLIVMQPNIANNTAVAMVDPANPTYIQISRVSFGNINPNYPGDVAFLGNALVEEHIHTLQFAAAVSPRLFSSLNQVAGLFYWVMSGFQGIPYDHVPMEAGAKAIADALYPPG